MCAGNRQYYCSYYKLQNFLDNEYEILAENSKNELEKLINSFVSQLGIIVARSIEVMYFIITYRHKVFI